ncbi:hypothetical protein [Dawidia soli]|uniref:Lipoprotein n=1 Tax=Dawidia soli TaxID=2782352 RepID=A0AAP2GI22_9BACT|nr:hypothetical protein [Dawidia soli]MBT1687786.1 hypothetical protein [Dawidia soli]
MNVKVSLSWVVLTAVVLGVTSCGSTASFYTDVTRRKTSLQYLHDTPPSRQVSACQVQVAKPVVTDPSFIRPGSVRTARSYIVPVIVYTEWGSQFDYRLGSASIQQDVASFVQSALITESARSGIFTADSVRTTGDLVLEIEIDSVGALGQYFKKGYFIYLFFAYAYDQKEGIAGSMAYARCRYRLRKGDTILIDDVVESQHAPQTPDRVYSSPKLLRADFNSALIEALSLSLKDNIEKIVQEVNGYCRFTP